MYISINHFSYAARIYSAKASRNTKNVAYFRAALGNTSSAAEKKLLPTFARALNHKQRRIQKLLPTFVRRSELNRIKMADRYCLD